MGAKGRRSARRGFFAATFLLAIASMPVGSARGDTPAADDVPPGAVAFFPGGACPEGWAPAADVEGRAIVGATAGPVVGVTVGEPLADAEDRTHAHVFRFGVKLPPHGAAAFDGSNDDGAAARTYEVAGTTEASTSGLPFIQVQACAKL